MEFLWATPVMEHDGLFNEEQLCMFAKDAGGRGAQAAGQKDRVTNSMTPAWTQADSQDNEKFFAAGVARAHAHPETVWEPLCSPCASTSRRRRCLLYYISGRTAGTAMVDARRAAPEVARGNGCWAAVQANVTHHDVHTHAGSSLAGTLYLACGGARCRSTTRGGPCCLDVTYRSAARGGIW